MGESPFKKFVQEIDFEEIQLLEVVGKGSYGTVRKGKWRDIDVAVKIIETDQEKKAFIVEVNQLSRVDHVNIVKLYGACTKVPVCLVMEYAGDGSLYKVLHCMKQVQYTAAHALSWMLQTAYGVAYLHNMKPRPLIHRDLKPPNLLLINGGTVLKICDFGTACDKHTNMTNSKGSAAWMAPEVFEGSQYSEKCDVFSWGIILWEVLTREKPFCDGEGGASAFRVMWAVHNGKRPPLIQGCPRALESLMTRCWAKNPNIRPSMTTVQNELSSILKYMKGADVPIIFSETQASAELNVTMETPSTSTSEPFRNDSASSGSKTFLPNLSAESPPNDFFLSVEPLGEKYAKDMKKRKSADLSNVDFKFPPVQKGHRRTRSYDSPVVKASNTKPSENCVQSVNNYSELPEQDYKDAARNFVPQIPVTDGALHSNCFYLLEPKLQPLPPVQDAESIEIYEKHLNLARELFRYKNEIKVLLDRKNELLEQLNEADKSSTYIDEYIHLKTEKESLLKLRTNLQRQLEAIRGKQKGNDAARSNKDDWVVV